MATSFFDKIRTRRDLNYLVPELARAKRDQSEAQADLDALNKAAQALVQKQYGVLIANAELLLEAAKNTASELDEQVRTRAVADFEATGNKRPHPAVGVGEYTTLDYQEEQALQWGIQFGTCVKLDKRAFEKAAKALGNIEFVKISTEPRARIDSKLEGYLNE